MVWELRGATAKGPMLFLDIVRGHLLDPGAAYAVFMAGVQHDLGRSVRIDLRRDPCQRLAQQ